MVVIYSDGDGVMYSDGGGNHAWWRKIDDSGDGNGSDYDVDGFWLWDGWHNKGDIFKWCR